MQTGRAKDEAPDEALARVKNMALSHGQVRWILLQLIPDLQADPDSFDALLRTWRGLGIPDWVAERPTGRGRHLTFGFGETMELALAFALRSRGLMPRQVAAALKADRLVLRDLFQEAVRQRESGSGAPIMIHREPPGQGSGELSDRILAQGVYLDYQIRVGRNGMPILKPPRLVGPWGAVVSVCARVEDLQHRAPLPLSDMALAVLRLAAVAPVLKRGPPRAKAEAS